MLKRAVLGFSYGYRRDGPGLSNCALMRRLYEHFAELGEPQNVDLILQHKLVDAHKKEELGQYDKFCGLKIVHVINAHRVAGAYLDTDEVARQGVEFAVKREYTDLLILAYPYIHRPYCVWVTRRFAKPHGIMVGVARVGWIPADPLSEQRYTRNLVAPIIHIVKCKLLNHQRGI